MSDVPDRIWPETLNIRDTGLHDDISGPGQRIYTTAGFGYERREYIRADIHEAAVAAARAEMEALREGRDAYKDAYEDSKRLARLIDVAMHGEEGAAKQASLCDLVVPARMMRTDLAAARAEVEALRGALEYIAGASDLEGHEPGMWAINRARNALAALAAEAKP